MNPLSTLILQNWPQLLILSPVSNYLVAMFNNPAVKGTHLRWLRFLIQWIVCGVVLAAYVVQNGYWDRVSHLDKVSLLFLFVFFNTFTYLGLRSSGVEDFEDFTTFIGKYVLTGRPPEINFRSSPLSSPSSSSSQPSGMSRPVDDADDAGDESPFKDIL